VLKAKQKVEVGDSSRGQMILRQKNARIRVDLEFMIGGFSTSERFSR
jgi:hypothetical protein